jgi:hypothetical protein
MKEFKRRDKFSNAPGKFSLISAWNIGFLFEFGFPQAHSQVERFEQMSVQPCRKFNIFISEVASYQFLTEEPLVCYSKVKVCLLYNSLEGEECFGFVVSVLLHEWSIFIRQMVDTKCMFMLNSLESHSGFTQLIK